MEQDSERLEQFIASAGMVSILTGAGVSTSSGIPDYRDCDGNWKHAKPVQFNDFLNHDATRRRYWARSFAGWRRFGHAEPNEAHRALARIEALGVVDTLITQNVDGLHQRAGSQRVIDLHGRLDAVTCLDCATRVARDDWQQNLLASNPQWHAEVTRIKPDGDADLEAANDQDFDVPLCVACGGIMKPDVVFFGEAVPRQRVADAAASIERAGALLVVGSSLMVYSGLRFVRQALALGKPVAILNLGKTRADADVTLKLDADCGAVLGEVAADLAARSTPIESRTQPGR